MSVTNCLGCGQQAGYSGTWRGVEVSSNLLKKVCIEIAVNDSFVEKTIDAITFGAQTGTIGDGKICTSYRATIRIRNKETGETAIG